MSWKDVGIANAYALLAYSWRFRLQAVISIVWNKRKPSEALIDALPLCYRAIFSTSRENSTSEPLKSILMVVTWCALLYSHKARYTLKWIPKATNSTLPVTYAPSQETCLRLTG